MIAGEYYRAVGRYVFKAYDIDAPKERIGNDTH
jgi:hypothetical protein